MYLCIFSHAQIKLTRIEIMVKKPGPSIEKGDWNTKLVATTGESDGAKRLIALIDAHFAKRCVAPGMYQASFKDVYAVYRHEMDEAALIPEPKKPRTKRFYFIWLAIILLAIYHVTMKLTVAWLFAGLLILTGGKAGTAFAATIALHFSDTRNLIQRLKSTL